MIASSSENDDKNQDHDDGNKNIKIEKKIHGIDRVYVYVVYSRYKWRVLSPKEERKKYFSSHRTKGTRRMDSVIRDMELLLLCISSYSKTVTIELKDRNFYFWW